MSENIIKTFLKAAKQYPDNIAIIDKKGAKTSYSTLKEQVIQTAAHFAEKGIVKGDRVLVFIPMSIDLYRVVMALFYLGAVAVFIDEWVSLKRFNQCCEIADCKGFIGNRKAKLFSFLIKEARKIPVKLKLAYPEISADFSPAAVSADDTALITFTTGSTGTPKAADRAHGFLKAQLNVLEKKMHPGPEDKTLCTLPIVLFINLANGAASVIPQFSASRPEKMKPEKIFNQIKQHKVNKITASPFFIKKLSDYIIHKNKKAETIKKIITGGAPVFSSEAKLYQKAFPGAVIQILYGSTEAEPISAISATDLAKQADDEKGLKVGEVHPDIKIKIIKISDKPLQVSSEKELDKYVLPEPEIGEIIVTGEHVLKKYFKSKTAFSKNKITAGLQVWHRTGDAGFIKNGILYLTGRCSQMIRKEGQWISPFIFEHELSKIKGIKAGTILQIQNQLIVVIEPEKKTDKTEIKAKTKKILPKGQVIFTTIPRDPRHHSKIDYEKLKASIRSHAIHD